MVVGLEKMKNCIKLFNFLECLKIEFWALNIGNLCAGCLGKGIKGMKPPQKTTDH